MGKTYCRDCRFCVNTSRTGMSKTFRCEAPSNMMEVEDWYTHSSLRFKESPGEKNAKNDCPDFEEFGPPVDLVRRPHGRE